jgi:glycosyltransferase involved in cell wall biosynthesis
VTFAVVTSGFPRRSETFVLNELLALEARGLLGPVFATKPGDGSMPQPGAERILPRVRVLPAVGPLEQAKLVAAALDGSGVTGVHAYFAHTPAEVARRAAALLGVPFGFSVHAYDARKVAPSELRARAVAAACVVACNADVAEDVVAAGGAAQLLPHGVDLGRFRPAPEPTQTPLTLLAVGRLVPKKGFDVLVDAATQLRRPFRLRIVGDGPERDRLSAQIGAAGLVERVTLEAPLTHVELPAAYRAAHVVVVPSVRDASGDRDGLPNVVLEALASGRAVVASDVSAIGTAVHHEETGLLSEPGDACALAAAIERAAAGSALRARLASAGRALVERDFDLEACTGRLARHLEAAYA